jgi:formylglycine-generating enzyme required for sulfatase activity
LALAFSEHDMKTNGSKFGTRFFTGLFAISIALLLIIPSSRPSAETPQGKGGEVVAKPTPTPKKTTRTKTTSTPKMTPRKPAKTTRSTAPANDNKSKPDESAANERTYWESIRLSTDAEDFKAYLLKYPNGQYSDLARNTLRRLEAAKSTANSSSSNMPRTRTNQTGIEFVLIPPGSFMMGSTNGDADEKPAHQVTINYSFYMGKYEVTQAQWQSVMGNNPSNFKDCANCPVEQVSWDDAQNFVNKLNESNDGFRYRLPTEAEWEYACRAGTTGDYAGNLSEMAWYSENSGSKTHAVGGKRPNAWALADMHGNVWEWCQDWYHETYHGAPTDGSAWLSGGEQKYRVVRGGSWVYRAASMRSAFRSYGTPGLRYGNGGFRVVASARAQ